MVLEEVSEREYGVRGRRGVRFGSYVVIRP
jgi:hypothetical protein